MRIGYLQTKIQFGRVEQNLTKAAEMVSKARADLMVLPELLGTGYLFNSREELQSLAEPYRGGITTRIMGEVAAAKNMTIVVGFAERRGHKIYNSAAVITPSGPVACYRKMHLYNEEKLYFSPGNAAAPIIDIGKAKIGVMICFDWFFPETARSLALRGAQIICHPSNLVMPHCPGAMPVRALENKVFTVTANRIGSDVRDEKKLSFIGLSQVVTPAGKIRHRAPAGREELYVTTIDPAMALEKNLNQYNQVLADRRPKLYGLT